MKYQSIKAVAFDLIGTVFDPATICIADLVSYARQIEHWRTTRVYYPLSIGAGFLQAKPFADASEALNRLSCHAKLVAASNVHGPIVKAMLRNGNVQWFSWVMDYHKIGQLKPSLTCYSQICRDLLVDPQEVLFVTSNRGVGDDTEPKRIGMQTRLIDRAAGETLLDLVKEFV